MCNHHPGAHGDSVANDIDQTSGFDMKYEREEETEVTNRLLQQR